MTREKSPWACMERKVCLCTWNKYRGFIVGTMDHGFVFAISAVGQYAHVHWKPSDLDRLKWKKAACTPTSAKPSKPSSEPTANTRLLAYLTLPTALCVCQEAIPDCLKASSDSYLVVEASNRRPARALSSCCDRWWMWVMCR